MPALGRWNVFDAAVIVVLASMTAAAVAGYRRFHAPVPEISEVTPAQVVAGRGRPLTVRGRSFHPYLHAFVFAAGRAPALNANEPARDEAKARAVTAAQLDLTLPAVTPGAYDLYLFDEFQQVAVLPQAFTVVAPKYARAEMTATIRFFVSGASARLVAAGERDRTLPADPDAPPTEGAEVTAVRVDPSPHTTMEMRVMAGRTPDSAIWIGDRETTQQVDVELRVPLARAEAADEWGYHGAGLRAGQFFDLELARFRGRGLVIAVGEPVAASQAVHR